MTEKLIKYYYPGAVIYFIIYYILLFYNFKPGMDIISPIGVFFCFAVLLHVYKKSERVRNVWLLLSLAALIWTFTDTAWAICARLMGLDPESMDIFDLLYLFPNICIMTAALIYMKKFIKGMNAIQLFIDIFAISISCFIMFWFLFFKGSILLFIKNIGNTILFIYIITDFVIINCILVWFFSIRKGKAIIAIYVVSWGAATYAVIDLIYTYVYFYNMYVPDSIIDTIYVLAFFILARGGLLVLNHHNPKWADEFYSQAENFGNTRKSLILLAIIPSYIIFKGFDFEKILILFSIFVVYEIVSNYVQNAINNEKLLINEKNMTLMLEEKIKERTKELQLKNEELEYASNYDFVTNIYNVRYFNERLDYIINEKKYKDEIIIFYIDVDRFKTINDTYGHDVGNYVLIEISKRLKKETNSNSILARMGGDEFVIAIEGHLTNDEIEKIVQNIIESVNKTIYIENYQFNITISIGIAVFPSDGESRNILIKNADIAMYDAKSKGVNKYSLFNDYMNSIVLERNEIDLLLRNADYNKEFKLYYQPQIDINTNKLVGMEALIRWNSPVKGNIPPNKFIKIAEETGCIERISDWVMNTAAEQIGVWNKKFGQNFKMGINISPNQLDGINFAKKLDKIIKKYELNSDWIDIEITENIAMKGETGIEEIFSMLSDMGISISIDDFGTGYSSLNYIQQFSFDRLKIAKELIDNITTDLNKKYIVKAIVNMSDALNILTIAEGVETKEQFEIIKETGCNQAQGYLFGKPVEADVFEKTFLLSEK